MAENLVIVESPAKAKTIKKFLGKGFEVASSYGHIRDLPSKSLSIDLENNFTPEYEISNDKKKIVAELKKLSKASKKVWLASDEDREGEAISWHLYEVLNLEKEKTNRIVFHEITKSAITHAIKSPREINKNLVDAQQARRILDRIVGYELSPVLWKKVKPSLSAGRVQSVAVRLIVEKENEITNFKYQAKYRVKGLFKIKNNELLHAVLTSQFENQNEAKHFLESCKDKTFIISDIVKRQSKRSPSAPFTTSTLQQEAGLKLGFSVTKTMLVAQKLYEAGKITYMRTDSVTLSKEAIEKSRELITDKYGIKYAENRQFKNKSKNAQEAHEAIRPSYLHEDTYSEGDNDQHRLYELIWKRTIASQMRNAEIENTTYLIQHENSELVFESKGEVIKFDGFLKLYATQKNENKEEDVSHNLKTLPKLEKGFVLETQEIIAEKKFSTPPARYTEAGLVKKMEQLGIGRPSTYAPTINTIQKRGYIIKEDREGKKRTLPLLILKNNIIKEAEIEENYGFEKKKLFPTDIGVVVTNFLTEHFTDILDYGFTASVESQFDEISQGEIKWTQMIKNFYKKFHPVIENTIKTAERSSGERILGEHPDSKKPVMARLGKFGPIIQIGSSEDEEKPKFASLLKHQSLSSITLKEALELFRLPRSLGFYKEKEITVAIGRFGPYVKYENLFCSIKKSDGDDPFTISLKRAIEIVEKKIEQEKNKNIKAFEEENIQILNGRYGPYIKFEKKNYKIPKTVKDPKLLTLEECKEIINTPKKSRRK